MYIVSLTYLYTIRCYLFSTGLPYAFFIHLFPQFFVYMEADIIRHA